MKILMFILWGFITTAASAQQIFTSEEYGFSIEEPAGWVSDLNINHYFNLDKNDGKNLLTFYKYKRGPIKDINPMINVSVEYSGLNDERFFKRYLKEFNWNESYYITHELVKKPEVIVINGNKAIMGTVHFKYNSHGTKKTTFRKRIYYIPHEKYLFKIIFIDDYTTEDNTPLFNRIASTLKIMSRL